MRKKSLKIIIKQKKMEIEQISVKLFAIKNEIAQLVHTMREIQHRIDELDRPTQTELFTFATNKEYIQELHQNLRTIKDHLATAQKTLDELQKKLKELYAQKEGLEKLLEKQINEERKRQTLVEGRLADENFIRKYLRR